METPLSLSSDAEAKDFLSEYCDFTGERVYILSVMARPRENEEISHGSMPVFREIMTKESDPRRKYDRLKAIANDFVTKDGNSLRFRMYLSANARDVTGSFHLFQKKLLDLRQKYENGHDPAADTMARLDKEWVSQLQSESGKLDSRFIIDVDEDSMKEFETVQQMLTDEDVEQITAIESANGFHIVTEPFNYPESKIVDRNTVEIKTDNLLFIRLL